MTLRKKGLPLLSAVDCHFLDHPWATCCTHFLENSRVDSCESIKNFDYLNEVSSVSMIKNLQTKLLPSQFSLLCTQTIAVVAFISLIAPPSSVHNAADNLSCDNF